MNRNKQICIIGAGASGMAAAVSAARTNPEACILLLEKKGEVGAKILATGNGRCNITNAACGGMRSTLRFFESIGVQCREEADGRMYPFSGQARDVRDALQRAVMTAGCEVVTGISVLEVRLCAESEHRFRINCNNNWHYDADMVLIAAGGKAGPQHGTSGESYQLAKKLGHSVGRLAPVLTSLETAEANPELKGIRAKARVSLCKGYDVLASEDGELQFTETGVSGICIFNLSRFVTLDEDTAFGDYTVSVDFLPEVSRTDLITLLSERQSIRGLRPRDILSSIVDRRIAAEIINKVRKSEINSAFSIGELEQLANILKNYRLRLSGAGGWKVAQCTKGGVPYDEINIETMESKLVPGLYFAGEVLDYDGPCGGFNLQHAWETGIAAGEAMGANK